MKQAQVLFIVCGLLLGCSAPSAGTPTAEPLRAVPTQIPLPVLPTTVPPTATALPPPTPLPEALSLAARQTIFREVWQVVHDNYLYEDFNGVDWDALQLEYRSRIEATAERDAFYAILSEMVGQLNDEHSRFVPPIAAEAENISTSSMSFDVGIGVIVMPRPNSGFIQVVFPDSPAERAGLRPRDRIIAVDGRPYTVADGDLRGPLGSLVRLTVARSGMKLRDVVVKYDEVQRVILPYARRFPGDIAYLSIPTLWVNDMGEQASGALTDLVGAGALRGLIIDVRANRGGWGDVLSDVLSHFVRGQVGTFYGRNYVRPLVVDESAGPDLRRVPVVVLIDNDTASYAEVLAAILQLEAQAQVVGTRSAGNTETIYAYSLIDGSRLWLAQEGFRLPNGRNLEGQGLEPDVLIDIDWTRFSEEDDPHILEALRLLGAGPK
ncbi:MAG TPA: S41 family peptidase [Roseiflexaceae bacterium]|nr:S41 family peptidase [Roseiflexaceae bacterium]HMP39739.1 S41 family peptidase [Roseiflexaceae bacterium]